MPFFSVHLVRAQRVRAGRVKHGFSLHHHVGLPARTADRGQELPGHQNRLNAGAGANPNATSTRHIRHHIIASMHTPHPFPRSLYLRPSPPKVLYFYTYTSILYDYRLRSTSRRDPTLLAPRRQSYNPPFPGYVTFQ